MQSSLADKRPADLEAGMFHRRAKALLATAFAGLVITACAGASIPLGSTQGKAPLTGGAPTAVEKIAADGEPDGYAVAPGNVVAVYSRLASGLNRCWLREGGALGHKYILHADVAPPPSRTATMTIHLRTKIGRRGLKTYRLDLESFGDQTKVISTNLKLVPRQAALIVADVQRWSAGERSCSTNVARAPNIAGGNPSRPKKP
jgi:hypothetical protein